MSIRAIISLPQEVLVDDLFPKLPSLDLIKASCVCRLWRQLAFDPKLWQCFLKIYDKRTYEADFGDIKTFGLSLDDLPPMDQQEAIRAAAHFLTDLKRAGLTVKEDAGVTIVDVPRMTSFKSVQSLLQKRLGNGLQETDFTRLLNSQLREYSSHRRGSSRFLITSRVFNESLNRSKAEQLALIAKPQWMEMPSLLEAHLFHVLLKSPLPDTILIVKSGMGQEFGEFQIQRGKEANEALDFYDGNIQQLGIVGLRRLINHDSSLRIFCHQVIRLTPWKRCFIFTFPVVVYNITNLYHWIINTPLVDQRGSTLAIIVFGVYYYLVLIASDIA